MFATLIVLLVSVVFGSALPVLFNAPTPPSIAFGFGSGFSSNIGGISHSNSIGAAYQSGGAQAYGAGLGVSNNGVAQGVGIAHAAPAPSYHQPALFIYSGNRPNSATSAQNNGLGLGFSSAQAQNNYGSAISAAQNSGLGYHQSAISSAQKGPGFQSAISSSNGLGYGSAVSAAQNVNGNQLALSSIQGYGSGQSSAIAASQNYGGHQLSIAQSSQQRGNGFLNSGASSISSPGFQAVQSHAVNSVFF